MNVIISSFNLFYACLKILSLSLFLLISFVIVSSYRIFLLVYDNINSSYWYVKSSGDYNNSDGNSYWVSGYATIGGGYCYYKFAGKRKCGLFIFRIL